MEPTKALPQQGGPCDALVIQSVPATELDELRDPFECLGGENGSRSGFTPSLIWRPAKCSRCTARRTNLFESSRNLRQTPSRIDGVFARRLCQQPAQTLTIGLTEEAESFRGVGTPAEIYPSGSAEDFAFFAFDVADDEFTSLNDVNPLDLSGLKNRDGACLWKTCFRCIASQARARAFGPSHGGAQFRGEWPTTPCCPTATSTKRRPPHPSFRPLWA